MLPPECAELFLDHYPGLRDQRRAAGRRALLLYLLREGFPDEERGAEGYFVTPFQEICAVAGTRNAGDALVDLRDRVGVEMDIGSHCWRSGQARTVRLQLEPSLEEQLLEVLGRARSARQAAICFRIGDTVRGREYQAALAEEETRRRTAAACPPDHAARELQQLLHSQPERPLRQLVEQNREAAWALLRELPPGLRMRQLAILEQVERLPRPIFRPVEHSSRLYAPGSLNCFTRELRRLILRGATTYDLVCAQLAIVARLWEIRSIHSLLAGGGKPWNLWLDYIGLGHDPARYKPVLKEGVYRATFAATTETVLTTLADGTRRKEGLGQDRAERLLGHPTWTELFERRDHAMAQILKRGGAENAFERLLPLPAHPTRARDPLHDARSLLAQVAQSWEMRIMTEAAYPVLAAEQQNAWTLNMLHDSITLLPRRVREQDRIERRLCGSVEKFAADHDIPTRLEKD